MGRCPTWRVDLYRKGLARCEKPVGAFRNEQAATFTMVHCADTSERAFAEAEESMVWYPKHAVGLISEMADWMACQDLGSYGYAGDMKQTLETGALDHLTMDYIVDSGAAVVGDPDRCVEIAKRYEASGCDLLFCLLNPYKMTHEQVMHSIELLGRHVIPEFEKA